MSDFTSPGIYLGIDNDVYHSGPEISNSSLGAFKQSPYHYWSKYRNPNRPEEGPKAGQLEGTLAHCAILESSEMHDRYVVGPDVNRNTKIWKQFVEDHPHATVIKRDQWDAAYAQRNGVLANTECSKLLSIGEPEVSAYWTDPETGVNCRVRPDWVHQADGGVILIDLKTYSDASPAEFARQIGRKDYHRQCAFYIDGYQHASGQEVLGFIFLSVESHYPYACNASMLDDQAIEAGRRQYQHLLREYAECDASDEWPSYGDDIDLVSLSPWILEQY